MTLIGESIRERRDSSGLNRVIMGAFVCNECRTMCLGFGRLNSNQKLAYSAVEWLEKYASIVWIPPKGQSREFEDVPEHVASAASEAYECLSIGALRAATLMARSVVEATAKEEGITTGNLVEKIDEMRSKDLIRPLVADAAHEIRHFGNDMAHGDFTDPVQEEEAEEVLTLMAEILNEVFQSPARLARRTAARLARKQQSEGATATPLSPEQLRGVSTRSGPTV